MLTYLSPTTRHAPLSSSPLNPLRSSSPPPAAMSSPTRTLTGAGRTSLPRLPFSSPASHRSSPTPTRPRLSTRYARTLPASSLRANSSGNSDIDVFGDGGSPTHNAMWRDRLHRRMAERERRQKRRADEIARRRGLSEGGGDVFDDDEDEAERRAQADDEELFRRLMVLQRRREQHVLSDYDGEGLEFWQDELDAVAAEERAICDRLSQMEPEYDLASPATSTCITASGTLSSANPAEQYLVSHDDAWATQAAQFEADEDEEAAAQFAAMREYEYRVETAHGYGHDDWYGAAGANVASASANVNVNVNGHVNSDVDVDTDMELGPEDWAAIQAMEAAMDDAMDVE